MRGTTFRGGIDRRPFEEELEILVGSGGGVSSSCALWTARSREQRNAIYSSYASSTFMGFCGNGNRLKTSRPNSECPRTIEKRTRRRDGRQAFTLRSLYFFFFFTIDPRKRSTTRVCGQCEYPQRKIAQSTVSGENSAFYRRSCTIAAAAAASIESDGFSY